MAKKRNKTYTTAGKLFQRIARFFKPRSPQKKAAVGKKQSEKQHADLSLDVQTAQDVQSKKKKKATRTAKNTKKRSPKSKNDTTARVAKSNKKKEHTVVTPPKKQEEAQGEEVSLTAEPEQELTLDGVYTVHHESEGEKHGLFEFTEEQIAQLKAMSEEGHKPLQELMESFEQVKSKADTAFSQAQEALKHLESRESTESPKKQRMRMPWASKVKKSKEEGESKNESAEKDVHELSKTQEQDGLSLDSTLETGQVSEQRVVEELPEKGEWKRQNEILERVSSASDEERTMQRKSQTKELRERVEQLERVQQKEEEQRMKAEKKISQQERDSGDAVLDSTSKDVQDEQKPPEKKPDLDALAASMARKKVKKQKGLSKFFKSLNNIGMGKQRKGFIQNLAMMLGAGLPLIDAMRTLEVEMKQKAMKKIIRKMVELTESGHPLWRAMEEQYIFSPYEIALVRVGEEAGSLARNMQYLSEQLEKDHALKQKVKMAMIYPSIVMILMFIVVMGLGLFVLPNLVQVLYSLNAELPLMTRVVIYITNLFSEYGMQAVPMMLIGIIVLLLLAKYTALKVVAQWMVFKIPGVGQLAKDATIARFGVILGGLLDAGVPLVEALASLEDVTTIVSYKKFYKQLTERVALGDSFALCFKDVKHSNRLIPTSMQQLIVTGERSGSLASTFRKVAEIYEKKAAETAEKLPVILEPMLLLFIGGLVGSIAFAIITPIYSVVGNVGR